MSLSILSSSALQNFDRKITTIAISQFYTILLKISDFSNLGSSFIKGSVAEWSKALVLGTSPKGRGFESHRCQIFY